METSGAWYSCKVCRHGCALVLLQGGRSLVLAAVSDFCRAGFPYSYQLQSVRTSGNKRCSASRLERIQEYPSQRYGSRATAAAHESDPPSPSLALPSRNYSRSDSSNPDDASSSASPLQDVKQGRTRSFYDTEIFYECSLRKCTVMVRYSFQSQPSHDPSLPRSACETCRDGRLQLLLAVTACCAKPFTWQCTVRRVLVL